MINNMELNPDKQMEPGSWQLSQAGHRCAVRVAMLLALIGATHIFSGCAALTNPVANGIPVYLLPPELLAEPREDKETIPLNWLSQEPPEIYRLAAGDILGIYIDGILGAAGQLPPVNTPGGDYPPALGFPIPVREDGTVPLPLIDAVQVDGMSISEATQAIIAAYTVKKQILQKDRERILVSLLRPRTIRVLVVRQDAGGSGQGNRPQQNSFGLTNYHLSGDGQRGSGQVVELAAYENDVLNALTRTGGLPGLDAVNEVIVERGGMHHQGPRVLLPNRAGENVTRIPLRIRPGEAAPFKPEDVILENGDIVFIESRDSERYYTAGLMRAQEVPLPRDYDLTVVEAIARIGAPINNGGINSNNINGQILQSGIGGPSPSLVTVLRRAPDGRQVNIRVDLNLALRDPNENILIQSGDVLILQETPEQAMTRYLTNVLRFNVFTDFSGNNFGSFSSNFP